MYTQPYTNLAGSAFQLSSTYTPPPMTYTPPPMTYTPSPRPILYDQAEMPPEISLTRKGLTQAERSSLQWADRAFRNLTARNHLLTWLYDRSDSASAFVAVEGFRAHPKSIVIGHFLSIEDVRNAVAYLCGHELIRIVKMIAERSELSTVSITPRGIECVEQGGKVADYLSPSHDQANFNNYGSITAGNFVMGDDAKPTIVIGSIDAKSLSNLADAIDHVIPNLHLDTEDQKAARQVTGEIVVETGAPSPSSRRLHSALMRLRELLIKAGDEAFITAVDYQLAKLGLPKTR